MDDNTPPTHLWHTPFSRAVFGFNAEMVNNPDNFYTAERVQGLIDQEKFLSTKINKTLRLFFLLNIIALMYLYGVKTDFIILGNNIPELPFAPQVICFLIGAGLYDLSYHSLSLFTVCFLRNKIVREATGTEHPNMTLAHIKGEGAWLDAISLKTVGYQSGITHVALSIVFLLVMFGVQIGFFIAGGAALIASFNIGIENTGFGFDWPTIMALLGLGLGITGILMFIIVLMIPFKFKWHQQNTKDNLPLPTKLK